MNDRIFTKQRKDNREFTTYNEEMYDLSLLVRLAKLTCASKRMSVDNLTSVRDKELLFDTNIQRRLLLAPRVSDQPRRHVAEEVPQGAVACVLDLRDVLQLVIDRLDQRSLAQEQLV